MTPNRLRQIAILVDSLDTQAADRLLDQLPEALQQRVRDAVMDLESVADSERQTVLAEFRRGAVNSQPSSTERMGSSDAPSAAPSTYQPVWRTGMSNHGGSALPRMEAERPSRDVPPEPSRAANRWESFNEAESYSTTGPASIRTPPMTSSPLPALDLSETLSSVDVESLASVVLRESPQVLAAVLSLLSPMRSAQLLEFCPQALQSAALQRLHHLEELDDEVVHLLQQELRLVIRQRTQLKQKQRVGSQALAEILVAAEQLKNADVTRAVRTQLQGEPAARKQALPSNPRVAPVVANSDPTIRRSPKVERPEVGNASSLPSEDRLVSTELDQATALSDFEPRLQFTELMDCDTASLQALLATAKPQLTLLALRGASQALLDRVLKMLPRSEAKEVQFRIQNLGPTRVQDIQQAQQYLLRLASLLEDMGRFRRPLSRVRSAA